MSLQSKIRIPQSLIPAESSRHCAHRPVEGALSVDVDVLEFVVVGLSVLHIVVNVLIGYRLQFYNKCAINWTILFLFVSAQLRILLLIESL